MEFLDKLRILNRERCETAFKHSVMSWNIMEWGCAAAGEMGELCNLLKKHQREITGIEGSRIQGDYKTAIAEEVADVIIYLDLLCEREGIDLQAAIMRKFNKTSEKVGYNAVLR